MEGNVVGDVMTSAPRSVGRDTNAVEAARIMASEDVGALPVVEGDELVGIVTDRDLVLHVVANELDPLQICMADICTERPLVASPEEPLDRALERMAEEQVRRLPVVSEGRLVGILAQADVARSTRPAATGQMVAEISAD